MFLTLFRSSISIIFIDDDRAYLETMGEVVGNQYRPRFYANVFEVDEALTNQDVLLRKEQQLLGAINAGGEHAPIITALQYFAWPGRHQIVTVLISDQAMPAETGVSVCGRHMHFGLRRILLTGAADSQIAVEAFNKGSIDLFIPKQSAGLLAQINEALHDQIEKSFTVRDIYLRGAIPSWARNALTSSRFCKALNRFFQRWGFVEYIIIGQPFGVLGINNKGDVFWCPIENETTLNDISGILEDLGWPKKVIDQIAKRTSLCNVELVSQMAGVEPAIAHAITIEPNQKIFITAFPLPTIDIVAVPSTHVADI